MGIFHASRESPPPTKRGKKKRKGKTSDVFQLETRSPHTHQAGLCSQPASGTLGVFQLAMSHQRSIAGSNITPPPPFQSPKNTHDFPPADTFPPDLLALPHIRSCATAPPPTTNHHLSKNNPPVTVASPFRTNRPPFFFLFLYLSTKIFSPFLAVRAIISDITNQEVVVGNSLLRNSQTEAWLVQMDVFLLGIIFGKGFLGGGFSPHSAPEVDAIARTPVPNPTPRTRLLVASWIFTTADGGFLLYERR